MLISLLERYSQLKHDYESYQKMAEEIMQKQSMKIIELDKKLDMLSLIVEISEYINRCLGSSEIVSMINDIMIGILGVTYSSVYLIENRKLKLKASNLPNTEHHHIVDEFNDGKKSKPTTCLVNSLSNICKDDNIKIHSSIFMPIYLKDDVLGAIVVEHNIYNYLREAHIKLLTALSNQIAICIENNKLYNKIKENSERDSLTGLFNRSYFFSSLEDKFKDSKESFAIVMIDIDDFKKCNDTYGHQYGDIVLKEVSVIIKNSLREEDMIARYGGEEIIIYMYNIKDAVDVYNRMSKIRILVESTAIRHKDISYSITVSIGISVAEEKDETLEQIVRRADLNLYKAKNSGKNKVVY